MSEWMAFHEVEGGWGEERADLRAGIIASQVHNMSGRIAKDLKSPADFMPRLVEEDEPTSWEVMKMRAMSLNAAMGGTFK